jgi:hypothetical protein
MDDSTDLDEMTQMANDLDDLGNLFEFGDIDLNNIHDAGDFGGEMQQQHGTHPNTPFLDMSEPPSMAGTAAHDFGRREQFAMSQHVEQSRQHHYLRQQEKHAPSSNPYSMEPIYQASVQQAMYQPQQSYQLHPQHIFPPNQHVPPTPNSFEMHGEAARFMQQQSQMDPQQRAIMEQRYGIRKDDAIAFTPMVSPAGTPQYHMLPEFTTPGAYFSPLTSPMLHAQNQQHPHMLQQQQQGYMTNPSTAPSSNTNSPIDPLLDVDMLGDDMVLPDSAGPQPRKSRRKVATPRSVAAGTRGQQKTAQKAQKRKSTSPNVPLSAGDGSNQRSIASQPPSAGLQMPAQFDSSGGSISPEPLSESVMGPPPRPGSRSVHQSPNIIGQPGGGAVGPAATPKSLLTMRSPRNPINGQNTSSQSSVDPANLDDLSLPEAATTQSSRRPSLTQINTQIPLPGDDENTPRLSARKTPKLGPMSTPSSARLSAVESPAVGSPMSATTPSAILNKKDSKNGRGNKKRGSMSANGSKLVSPALVPKISPSIKPLLPEGSKFTNPLCGLAVSHANVSVAPLTSAQQAMLLASKSNYQNLVEGNRLPGVTYPDSLSTGLTSKRTSHKVAEQGRRNRINDALKEMQALIPKPSPSARSPSKDEDADAAVAASPDVGADDDKVAETNGVGKESKEDAAARSNSSKAATVELANEYIKRIQKDSAIQNAEVEKLKRENEELKRRLVEASGASSGAEEVASPERMSGTVTSPAST